jgi:RNA polymerase sigma-70 factor (ECF subfamily)
MWYKLPYCTGVLEDAPTGPDLVLMPGGGRAGREDRGSALFPSPAGNFIKGDPVGTAGEVRREDADAAEELFKGVYPKLAGWVRRLVDDDETAHEIASEAFVRLLARWTKVDSPQSYLYMIATNLVRDHWRKTERERRAIRSVTAGATADPLAYPMQDVDVRNLIASLPPRLRDPFLLHYYGGFAIREVATLLRRPEGTIKADLFAARARLKTALGDRDG